MKSNIDKHSKRGTQKEKSNKKLQRSGKKNRKNKKENSTIGTGIRNIFIIFFIVAIIIFCAITYKNGWRFKRSINDIT